MSRTAVLVVRLHQAYKLHLHERKAWKRLLDPAISTLFGEFIGVRRLTCEVDLLVRLRVANQRGVPERRPRFETWGVLILCGIWRVRCWLGGDGRV